MATTEKLPYVRRAVPRDGAAVARVMNSVIAEGRWSAATERVTAASERRWLASLAPHGAAFVAEAGGEVVGFQTIEPFSPYLRSMRHVGVVGTQVEKA